MRDDTSGVVVAERRLQGDTGGNLVEYALLVALIFLVALTAVQLFGKHATDKMNCSSSAITNATAVTC